MRFTESELFEGITQQLANKHQTDGRQTTNSQATVTNRLPTVSGGELLFKITTTLLGIVQLD